MQRFERIVHWVDRRLAVRQRASLGVLGLVIVLVVLIGAIAAATWLREGAIADQRLRLDDVATVLAQHASRTADSVDLVLGIVAERIASRLPVIGEDAAEMRQLLRDHVAGQPYIRSVLFLDAKGIGRGDSEAAPARPIDASDRPYFLHHVDQPGRDLYIGTPVWSRVSNQWTVVLSRRVQALDGTFLGVVAAGLDPGVFSDFYRDLSIGSVSTMSLTRSDAILIARHPREDTLMSAPVSLEDETDPRRVVSAMRTVDRYPLIVMITMSLKTALSGWEHQVMVIGGATFAILLFIGTIGFFLLDQSDRLEKVVGALASARDDAIRARLREEDAGRAKSSFLANTSHELRTPLNAILGFSEVLRDGHVGILEPKQRGYAASIHDAGTHLLGLISDLLDMAKIEARELQLRETVVDFGEVIADSVRLTEGRATDRGIVVIAKVENGPISIRGDAQRLRQIALNLLSNAIKFTSAGGRVWIEAVVDAGGRPTLIVSDTGIGMSPEEIEVAMTPFRQVESPLTREHEGTGLGLPIVKALIDLHGGYLKIESERGVGSRVTVSLPASRLAGGTPADIKAAAT